MKKITPFFALLLTCTLSLFSHDRLPIVYSPQYNVSLGFCFDTISSWMHPFDGKKYGKIYKKLKRRFRITDDHFHQPTAPVSDDDLARVHDKGYLASLTSSNVISHAIDLDSLLAWMPNNWFQKGMLTPLRYQTAGTVLAAELALEKGWAINLGGGFHHAKRDSAGGGCFFNDIPLAIETVWKKNPEMNVLIVDLDAHQGNGHEDYFKESFGKEERKVFIFDMYNKNEYPNNPHYPEFSDDKTSQFIDHPIALDGGHLEFSLGGWIEKVINRTVSEKEYLKKLKTDLPAFIESLDAQHKKPQLIIYNAGTDPYRKDPWGCMAISREGMIERDRFVFKLAEEKNIPIAMVLSGGYAKDSAQLITKAITAIIQDKKKTSKKS